MKIETVIAVGAHPDDIELGCGGSIAKLKSQGVKVVAIVLTGGTKGGGVEFNRSIETTDALNHLGVDKVELHDFPDTFLETTRQDIIKVIEEAIKRYAPQRLYTMFKDDRHQDHRAVYEASIIASRSIPQVVSYETPSSWPNFMPVIFEELTEDQMTQKCQALRLHVSQKDRDYTQPDHLRIAAKFRGQQIGLGYTEGFIPYKFVL